MRAAQQLRKPENWSDFESLCKKLWGEIWNGVVLKNVYTKRSNTGYYSYGINEIDYGKNERTITHSRQHVI